MNTQWPGDETGWLITLSDLTLLLLCFLGLWYVKDRHAIGLVQATTPAGRMVPALPVVSNERSSNVDTADWIALRGDIREYISKAGISDAVSIEVQAHEILISINDAIPFDSGKADLNPGALPIIETVANIALERPGLHLEVSGHTDDRPISTTQFPSNWELSSARASVVARYLIAKGIQPSRIAVHGFAHLRPRVNHESLKGRPSNRRVEIRFVRGSYTSPVPEVDAFGH